MQQTCQIEIKYPSDRTTVLTIAHQTPEWARVIERGAGMVCFAIWVMGSIAGVIVAYHDMIPLSVPQQIVVIALLSGFAFVVGKGLTVLITDSWRVGLGPLCPIVISVSPEAINVDCGSVRKHIVRTDDVKFTCQPHRDGRFEQRAEQRIGSQVGYAYRDAFEVWLQTDNRFVPITSVADEPNARAIVRHLQDANKRALRGDHQQQALTRRLHVA